MVFNATQSVFEKTHALARHADRQIIPDDRDLGRDRPSNPRRCPCDLLRQSLADHMPATLFAAINAPTLAHVFATLAEIPSAALPLRFGHASATLLDSGRVIVWGATSKTSEDVFPGVKAVQIAATWCAVAALDDEDSVHTWGTSFHGGDCSPVQKALHKNTRRIQASSLTTFRATLHNGASVGWGGL